MSVQAFDLRCVREDLLIALQAAEAVVPGNTVKKILTNVHLKALSDQLIVSATDNQVGLRAIVRRLEVTAMGEVLIPARQFLNILKESSSRDVHLSLKPSGDNHLLVIELADGSYHLPILASNEFPVVGGFPEQSLAISVEAGALERMIRQTLFAVDKDRSSAVLSGLFIALNEGQLLMAATDGKVLAEARHTQAAYDSLPERHVVVPALTISHLSRMIGHAVGDIALAIESKLVFIRAVLGQQQEASIQVELTSRLVEGIYPAYRNAIPTHSESAVTFATGELASAVRRCALMTSSTNRGIVMMLGGEQALLRNFGHSDGSAEIPVPCAYDGAAQVVGLNAAYLTDVLRVYSRNEVAIELNGPGRGMIMRDEDVTFLIMPITLPGS